MKVERPEDNEEKFWFPTPENPGNEQEHSPIQKRILKELRELAALEKLDPTENEESRTKFLSMFKWTDSLITGKDRKNLEDTIVEFNDIFARHKLDIGMNTQFKVSLTPQDDKPVCTQSLPVPHQSQRRSDCGASPHASIRHHHDTPILQICHPHLRTTETQRQVESIGGPAKNQRPIADDYINNNHPFSTLSDAAEHLAGKNCFASLTAPRCITASKWQIKGQ